MAEQNGMNAKIGTQKLEVLQDAVQTLENCAAEAAEAGGHVTYYQMTTPFFVPEIEDFQGAARMLVVVADGGGNRVSRKPVYQAGGSTVGGKRRWAGGRKLVFRTRLRTSTWMGLRIVLWWLF